MKRYCAILVVACVLPTAAADQFPLRITIFGQSQRSEEYKRMWKSPCVTVGMGAPCAVDEDTPGVTVQVFTVTGRITHRGRTVEYDLVCRSVFKKDPCVPLKYGTYPARWHGKRLEVLIETGKTAVNHYEVRGERDANID